MADVAWNEVIGRLNYLIRTRKADGVVPEPLARDEKDPNRLRRGTGLLGGGRGQRVPLPGDDAAARTNGNTGSSTPWHFTGAPPAPRDQQMK